MPAQSYKIETSPLYGVRSSRRLCEILGVSRADLNLLEGPGLYNEFESTDKNNSKKKRWIQAPVGVRKKLHKRLQILLSRVVTPDYLCSGKRGVSIRKNAEFHKGNSHTLTLDIQKFYESTKVEFVLRFFLHELKISADLAQKLAKACTCNGRIPTGSHLSQILAYWSYRPLFDSMNELAIKRGMVFTLYVDDMTFSSATPISKGFHLLASFLLKRVGLRIKNGKIEYYSAKQAKTITGTIVTKKGEIKVPNRRRKKIVDLMEKSGGVDKMDLKQLRSLIGSIQAAQIVEPEFMKATLVKCKVLSKRKAEELKRVDRARTRYG